MNSSHARIVLPAALLVLIVLLPPPAAGDDTDPLLLEAYQKHRKGIGEDDDAGWYRLALWCLAQGLREKGKEALEKVISIRPDPLRGQAPVGVQEVQGELDHKG